METTSRFRLLPLLLLLIFNFGILIECQNLSNLPPYFIPGSGDMARFSLSENSPVGSPVYQLKGLDPENTKVHYSISGPVFSVDRNTGVVRLRQELDREKQNVVEVIISLTDEGISGTEPNTISLRREIPIRDYNDNAPVFLGRPYTAKISESTKVGTLIDVQPQIIIIDDDDGVNSEIQLTCYAESPSESDICSTFDVSAEKITSGNYTANIRLLKPLDYESRPSYIMTIMARDMAKENQLHSIAKVGIDVIDVQDQPPMFINSPYSVTIEENTPSGIAVLNISALDGDTGNPRKLFLTLENEFLGHFELKPIGDEEGNGKVALVTTNVPLDRESLEILQKGGVYSFVIRATELNKNGLLTNDSATTLVTIVVTDVDDHNPEFNLKGFNIYVPENLGNDMPLPGLSLFANDRDLGKNSHYNLSLRNIQNSENVFTVSPQEGAGRIPVIIKVFNSEKLDYDVDDESLRTFIFDLIASVNGTEIAKSRINVHLTDENDNSPIFPQTSYHFKVEENYPKMKKISNIIAHDRDSGDFGNVRYVLKGFGSSNFYTNATTGGLYVKENLDFEKQTSYSLSLVAIDGGGRETNTNLHIDVINLNDNYPKFESQEYTRIVREGARSFEPQFFVRAQDLDGPNAGNISYTIKSENSISGQVFGIDEETGEITFNRVANSMDTEKGQYELTIEANDNGNPPLKNTTKVFIRVGISGNQRPIFKGHFRKTENLPVAGPPSYRVSLPENATAGQNVTVVQAHDPDGIDSLLRYRIIGSNDNFIIDDISGLIKVSPQARLDRDTNEKDFQIIVNAVDVGFPIPETATTTVYVTITDVNDEPPKFDQFNYIAHVSERAEIGSEVLKVRAHDPDLNAKLEYEIYEEIKATTKAGVAITADSNYNLQESFAIDKNSGSVYVNGSLRHDVAAVIEMKIIVRDTKAEINKEKQFALAEITIYIQSFKDTNPVFKSPGWKSTNSVINVKIKEEMPIDYTVLILDAYDPLNNEPVNIFEIVKLDDGNYFGLNERKTAIVLKKRLDYETLMKNTFELIVKATTSDLQRSTDTKINITVENVNDNSPIFMQSSYHATLIEGKKYPEKVITIRATDKDVALTKADNKIGYHKVIYSLMQSENSDLFAINNLTGEIVVAENRTIDREKNMKIKLIIKAEDSPGRPTDAKQALAELIIDVLDINDNTPIFLHKNYTAVIPENVATDSFVINVTATDPDEGPGGEVRYDIINEGEVYGLFKINAKTGEIRTKRALTGKGRSEPYQLIIQAKDNGEQVPKQQSLYQNVRLDIFIGDVSANDGIPYFIAPEIGQIANISENATIGSPVFQVIASDPDSPKEPSGTLFYRIQEDTLDAEFFEIDSISGLITTTALLDRETKNMYNIILEVTDNGLPRQSVTRILKIQVLDIDDHQPKFVRDIDSQPLQMTILEEEFSGTIVGNITAVDEDINENGEIDYMFIDGNHEGLFTIKRTKNNSAIITTNKKLDRETIDSYLLTVKCFKNGIRSSEIPRGEYDRFDQSQIRILILIKDIDDNLPIFDVKNPAIGIRTNVPIDTVIATIHATDQDADALPIIYSIHNITFMPQYYKRKTPMTSPLTGLFSINNQTGEIRTGGNFFDYIDGYFQLQIKANNSQKSRRHTMNTIKIFIIRTESLLKFIFAKSPTEIQNVILDFEKILQKKLRSMNLEIHLYDTQVYIKPDMSLDFTAATSCFQLFRNGTALPLQTMEKLMNSEQMKEDLLETYVQYGVSNIETCAVKRQLIASSLMYSTGTWLVIIAGLIGIGAIIATCSAYCMAKKYKKESKQQRSITTSSRTTTAMPANTIGTTEYFGSASNSAPVYYSEPIYGPL